MKFLYAVSALLITGILSLSALPVTSVPERGYYCPTVKVGYAPQLTLKQALTSPLWDQMPGYKFKRYITATAHFDRAPKEQTTVRYLYSDDNLFVRADCIDSDVISAGKVNQEPHFITGDVVEVFVKPENETYFWEFYGTPNKLFTCYPYLSRGMLGLPSPFGPNDVVIGVDSVIDGTFNDHRDTDKGWSVVIAIPRKVLEQYGCKFAPGSKWRLFTSRYNYGAGLPEAELSSYPQITRGFLSYWYYAKVEFINLETEK